MAAVLYAPTRNRATHPTLVVRRNVATAGPYLRRQPAAAKRDSWVRLWLHVCADAAARFGYEPAVAQSRGTERVGRSKCSTYSFARARGARLRQYLPWAVPHPRALRRLTSEASWSLAPPNAKPTPRAHKVAAASARKRYQNPAKAVTKREHGRLCDKQHRKCKQHQTAR